MTTQPAEATRTPHVTLAPSVCVRIEVPRSDQERDDSLVVADRTGTINRFLEWQIANEVFPYRGGSVSAGWLVQWFPAQHAERLEAFFAAEGLATTTDD